MKPILAVIDDEEEILVTYQEFFEDKHKVCAFSSAEKFLKELAIGKIDPDAAITDFKMPEMTGIDLIQKVRQLNKDFPFVLLSGHIEKEVALDAIDLGAFSVLEKPISFERLQHVVDRMMYEVELIRLREEIRHSVLQIKEIYEGLREALLPHVPAEILSRFFIEAEEGIVTRKLGLEDVLTQLETKLDILLKAEKTLVDLKHKAAH